MQGSDSDYFTVEDDYFNFAIDSEEDDNILLQRIQSPIKGEDEFSHFKDFVSDLKAHNR